MANEQNLIFFTSDQNREEAAKNGRKGGVASGQARREKKETKKILQDLLSLDAKDNVLFKKLAEKTGLTSDKSIHEVFAMICLLNSAKKGDLGDLEQLTKLLGENDLKDEKISKVEQLLAELTPNEYNTVDKKTE